MSKLRGLEQDHLEIDPKFASDGSQSTVKQRHLRWRNNSTLGLIFWCLLTATREEFRPIFHVIRPPNQGVLAPLGPTRPVSRLAEKESHRARNFGRFFGSRSLLSWLEIPSRLTVEKHLFGPGGASTPWLGGRLTRKIGRNSSRAAVKRHQNMGPRVELYLHRRCL